MATVTRFGRHLAPVLALVALTGCVSFDLLVKVRPDGSGTITRTLAFRTDWLDQMAEMMKGMGGEVKVEKDAKSKNEDPFADMFSEKDAREEAAKMGAGVRFVKATPTKTKTTRGQIAVYEFDDVRKLALSDEPPSPGPGGPDAPEKKGKDDRMTFAWKKEADGVAVLTVRTPPQEKAKPGAEKGSAPENPPTKEEMEQARKLLGGLRVAMAVEIDGTIVETKGGWREKNRVTLMEMDFDKLLSDEKLLAKLTASGAKSLDEAQGMLKDVPGMRIPTEKQEIVIRYR
jgi:hypothetical protein